MKPVGDFTEFDILKIKDNLYQRRTGVPWQNVLSHGCCQWLSNCRCLGLVLGGARATFQDVHWSMFGAKTVIIKFLDNSTDNFFRLHVMLLIQMAVLDIVTLTGPC